MSPTDDRVHSGSDLAHIGGGGCATSLRHCLELEGDEVVDPTQGVREANRVFIELELNAGLACGERLHLV